MTGSEPDQIKLQIVAETSRIAWHELQYFFAGGMAVFVAAELDLVEVAAGFAEDNRPVVEKWMQANLIMPVPDEQAKIWYENDAVVWAVVVKPWVLVQAVKAPQ